MKDRIEKILRLEQISSSKFADEIGVQKSSISHLFTGRNNPSLELVQKILARFSNINPEWLLTGKGDMYKKPIQTSLFENSTVSSKTDSLPVLSESHEKEILENQKYEINSDKYIENSINKKSEPKVIEKIIVFYSNNSFTEYIPDNK